MVFKVDIFIVNWLQHRGLALTTALLHQPPQLLQPAPALSIVRFYFSFYTRSAVVSISFSAQTPMAE